MALDETGITLAEVTAKYPRSFQVLGYDSVLDVDNMGKPKMLSSFQLCVNAILTLLLMKPGQYPSIPDLGIDIESYLHEYADDQTLPGTIKSAIMDQCNRCVIAGIEVDCKVDQTENGTNALVIRISADERLAYGSEGGNVIIGISYDKLNRLYARTKYF
jgi:hypothetical protein